MTKFTVEDQKSSGLQRNPEAENSQKTWNYRPKTCFMQENSGQMTRQSSEDSIYSEQNRDKKVVDIRPFFVIFPSSSNAYFWQCSKWK